MLCETIHKINDGHDYYLFVQPEYQKTSFDNAGGKIAVLYLDKSSGNMAPNILKNL